MRTSTWVLIIVVLVLLGGGYWWYSSRFAAPASNVTVNTGTSGGSELPNAQPEFPSSDEAADAVVIYSDQGFSPASTTIKAGQSVLFVNQSSHGMWVASAPHPAHSGYSGTDRTAHCPDTAGTAFDQCAQGASYRFVFTKAGTWPFHNHVSPGDTGKIVVTQ